MIHYENEKKALLRIAIFYDGNYFSHVSNFYTYEHPRRSRISVSGLHRFIVHELSKAEGVPLEKVRIVEAHYFRGRLSAVEAQQRNLLFRERQFEEVLMREGIISHFLPLTHVGEKGIDVWLALEALELTIHKKFDVVVLIASDGDYLSLVKKLNTLGTRVCVIGWDFEFIDNLGNKRKTRTAQNLLDEANYPFLMNVLIEDRARRSDPLINDLFMPSNHVLPSTQEKNSSEEKERIKGVVFSIKDGYGFIETEDREDNLFFHYSDLIDSEWFELYEGDKVEFELGENDHGVCARKIKKID